MLTLVSIVVVLLIYFKNRISKAMTKKEVLQKIRKAKTGHRRWMSYAKAIQMGLSLDKDAVPLIETDCQFGQWYYGEGQYFSHLDSFKAIEEPHSILHHKYMQIYKIKKQPLQTGLFITKKKALKKREEQLNALLEHMEQISKLLKETLEDFEEDIMQMSEAEIMQLTQ